jgi:hypothetical protein
LSRYCHQKNNKIALFAIEGIGFALAKEMLNDDKEILALFKLHTTVLEETAHKDIRTNAIRNMAMILKHIREPFE